MLVPDAMGHGQRKAAGVARFWRGERGSHSKAAQVADLSAFLSATGVDGPIDLVGYSMGGARARRSAWPSHAPQLRGAVSGDNAHGRMP